MKDYSVAFTNTAGGAFPNTLGVNASGPSATDGTEFVKLMVDDEWGARQDLMVEAGRTPSGNDEAVGSSDFVAALKDLFWQNLNMITGLVTSNNGADSQHDVDIATGNCFDSTNSYLFKLVVGLIKQIDASWAVGTNAGGLFTGAVAVDTWYAVFLIRKDSDGTIDAGFDTSSIAANIPGGYTAFRRIGWVLTDGSANILQFFDTELSGGGIERQWDGIINDVSANTSAARVVAAVSAAPDSIAKIAANKSGAVDTSSWVLPTSVTDFAPTGVNDSMIRVDVGADRAAIVTEVQVDSSSQIAYRSSTASATIRLNTLGYTDPRV